MISRRRLLAAAGLAVGGGVAVRAIDQGLVIPFEQPGLAAWDDWRLRRYQGPLALVSAAVLAASPHNSQPWRFAIGNGGVDLFEVPERQLGTLDPFGRERLAGLGAALANMALAAPLLGVPAAVRLLPDPADPRHIARLDLDPVRAEIAFDGLIGTIARRHTHRGAWTGAPIDPARRAALSAATPWPDLRVLLFEPASAAGRRFAALTREATAAIAGDAAMLADGHRWFRHGRRDQQVLQDGLTLDTTRLDPARAFADAMLPEPSPAEQGRRWLEATRDTQLPTASLFGLIAVADPHDRATAIRAGAIWQRLHLAATAGGLVAQPLNQLPEMIDRQRQLGRPPTFAAAAAPLLAGTDLRPTFAFRLGHAEAPAPASLRRPVGAVLGPPGRVGFEVEETRRRESRGRQL